MDWIYVIVPLALLGTFWVIAAFAGQWPWQSNPYNSYALQTDSWLKGRLDLGQDYPWLELAIYQGKYFVSFPPFPSYVLIPFVMIFGTNTPDHLIALLVTIAGVCTRLNFTERFLLKSSMHCSGCLCSILRPVIFLSG